MGTKGNKNTHAPQTPSPAPQERSIDREDTTGCHVTKVRPELPTKCVHWYNTKQKYKCGSMTWLFLLRFTCMSSAFGCSKYINLRLDLCSAAHDTHTWLAHSPWDGCMVRHYFSFMVSAFGFPPNPLDCNFRLPPEAPFLNLSIHNRFLFVNIGVIKEDMSIVFLAKVWFNWGHRQSLRKHAKEAKQAKTFPDCKLQQGLRKTLTCWLHLWRSTKQAITAMNNTIREVLRHKDSKIPCSSNQLCAQCRTAPKT